MQKEIEQQRAAAAEANAAAKEQAALLKTLVESLQKGSASEQSGPTQPTRAQLAAADAAAAPAADEQQQVLPEGQAPVVQQHLGARLNAAALSGAPAEEVYDEPETEAEAHELLAELDRMQVGKRAEGEFADAFFGRPLPLAHVRGPYPRDEVFEDRSCHYHPALAGDRMLGKLAERFEKIAEKEGLEGAEVYAYELRLLGPLLSYMYDLLQASRAHAARLTGAFADGTLPEGLADEPQFAVDMAQQTNTMLEMVAERVGVLRKIVASASGDASSGRAIMDKLYNNEHRVTGGCSSLEVAVDGVVLFFFSSRRRHTRF